jgi:hypothetical protein
VLEVVAQLPEIEDHAMKGAPQVKLAYLNGVSDPIREAYQRQPLVGSHIPRQLVCKVEGDAPSFTINLDERGQPTEGEIAYKAYDQQQWLRQRATVGQPARDADVADPAEGLDLLMHELTPDEIEGTR